MKVVILAGGLGTRISEETTVIPKPMISLDGKPIIMHIIEYFYSYGIREFVICCGYKSDILKQYFLNYTFNNSDIEINTSNNSVRILKNKALGFKVSIIDTGVEAQTAFRLKSVEHYIDDDFIFTYGDGLSNIDINKLVKTHRENSAIVTVTAVKVRNKFGLLEINEANNEVTSFNEKSFDINGGWINGGFMVIKKDIFKYLTDKITDSFEFDILPQLVKQKELFVYKHNGFWKCMDTLKDKLEFEVMISSGEMPWKIKK